MPTSSSVPLPAKALLRLSLLVLGVLAASASSSTSPPPPPQGPGSTGAAGPGSASPETSSEVELPEKHLYRGPHPVHPDFGSGFCERQDVHGEPYEPFEPELFAKVDGAWVFIGDPGDFDAEGPAYWYANPHPLPDEYGGDWCHYPWPHRHHFELSGEGYDLVGGFLYFVGAFTDAFFHRMHRKRDFFRRHYRRSYQNGALYRRHKPRYVQLGPGRYRRLYPRQGQPRSAFRPYRPSRSGLTGRPGMNPRLRFSNPARGRGHRRGLGRSPGEGRAGTGWQGRPVRRPSILRGRGLRLDIPAAAGRPRNEARRSGPGRHRGPASLWHPSPGRAQQSGGARTRRSGTRSGQASSKGRSTTRSSSGRSGGSRSSGSSGRSSSSGRSRR